MSNSSRACISTGMGLLEGNTGPPTCTPSTTTARLFRKGCSGSWRSSERPGTRIRASLPCKWASLDTGASITIPRRPPGSAACSRRRFRRRSSISPCSSGILTRSSCRPDSASTTTLSPTSAASHPGVPRISFPGRPRMCIARSGNAPPSKARWNTTGSSSARARTPRAPLAAHRMRRCWCQPTVAI